MISSAYCDFCSIKFIIIVYYCYCYWVCYVNGDEDKTGYEMNREGKVKIVRILKMIILFLFFVLFFLLKF